MEQLLFIIYCRQIAYSLLEASLSRDALGFSISTENFSKQGRGFGAVSGQCSHSQDVENKNLFSIRLLFNKWDEIIN